MSEGNPCSWSSSSPSRAGTTPSSSSPGRSAAVLHARLDRLDQEERAGRQSAPQSPGRELLPGGRARAHRAPRRLRRNRAHLRPSPAGARAPRRRHSRRGLSLSACPDPRGGLRLDAEGNADRSSPRHGVAARGALAQVAVVGYHLERAHLLTRSSAGRIMSSAPAPDGCCEEQQRETFHRSDVPATISLLERAARPPLLDDLAIGQELLDRDRVRQDRLRRHVRSRSRCSNEAIGGGDGGSATGPRSSTHGSERAVRADVRRTAARCR